MLGAARLAVASEPGLGNDPSRSRSPLSLPHAGAADIVINGRFYGQPVTGVQRYGREIVAALDRLLVRDGRSARLAMPAGARHAPPFRAITPLRLGPGTGHLWEQAALTFQRQGVLINLCNTGPGLVRRQVVCIHDTNVFTAPGSYRPAFRLLYRGLQPWLARRAAVVATVSRASAAAIARQFGLPVGRIALLPNGHEHALAWRADRARVAPALGPRPFVLLLGSRARHKNVGLLTGLAAALDERGLDLVVTGDASAVFTADACAASPPNLRRLGRVTDDDLALLFSRALCLAFPSLTEGFGLPLVEAMVHGCPVVASDRASMPEVCGGAALLAPPDDPVAWLAHVTALRDSADLRDELRERGQTQARRFSWTESAAGYLELVRSVA